MSGARSYSPPRNQEDFTQTDSFRMFSFKVSLGRRRGLAPVSMLGVDGPGPPDCPAFTDGQGVACSSASLEACTCMSCVSPRLAVVVHIYMATGAQPASLCALGLHAPVYV